MRTNIVLLFSQLCACLPIDEHRWVREHRQTQLRPRQNGCDFADIFKCIFLNENARISIKISLKFVPMVPTNNIPSLVQIMACRLSGAKPLSEPMTVTLLTRPPWVNLWLRAQPSVVITRPRSQSFAYNTPTMNVEHIGKKSPCYNGRCHTVPITSSGVARGEMLNHALLKWYL